MFYIVGDCGLVGEGRLFGVIGMWSLRVIVIDKMKRGGEEKVGSYVGICRVLGLCSKR